MARASELAEGVVLDDGARRRGHLRWRRGGLACVPVAASTARVCLSGGGGGCPLGSGGGVTRRSELSLVASWRRFMAAGSRRGWRGMGTAKVLQVGGNSDQGTAAPPRRGLSGLIWAFLGLTWGLTGPVAVEGG